MQIKIDSSELKHAEKLLESMGKKAKPMVAKSINRALRGVPLDASKKARETYNVKSTQIKGSFKIEHANKNSLSGFAESKGGPISLYHFNPRPRKPGPPWPKRGVSVKVKSTRKMIPGAFIGTLAKGGDPAKKARSSYAVFMRVPGKYMRSRAGKTKHSQYIKKRSSVSVPQMVDNDDVVDHVEKGANERFNKTLEHELDYALRKKGLR